MAAISVPYTVETATPERWREHFGTNVFAPPDAQLTDVAVRPRIELALRQDG